MMCLALCCGLAVAAQTMATPVTISKQEIQVLKNDHQNALLKKDIEHIKEKLNNNNKNIKSHIEEKINNSNRRIEDNIAQTVQALDRFGIIAAVLGVIVTVLLVAISFATYISVGRTAKEEAGTDTEEWFEHKGQEHQQQIDKLQTDFETKISGLKQRLDDFLEDSKKRFERCFKSCMQRMCNPNSLFLNRRVKSCIKQYQP